MKFPVRARKLWSPLCVKFPPPCSFITTESVRFLSIRASVYIEDKPALLLWWVPSYYPLTGTFLRINYKMSSTVIIKWHSVKLHNPASDCLEKIRWTAVVGLQGGRIKNMLVYGSPSLLIFHISISSSIFWKIHGTPYWDIHRICKPLFPERKY